MELALVGRQVYMITATTPIVSCTEEVGRRGKKEEEGREEEERMAIRSIHYSWRTSCSTYFSLHR